MATNRLGRGLQSLFDDYQEEDYEKNLGVTKEELSSGVVEIKISEIYANPNQPRKIFNPEALSELANSIKINGVISPIVLNKDSSGRYMIIAGERRFRASKMVGLETIPAVVKEYDDRKIKEISLIENLQREDLNPIEAANAMKQLMDAYDLTQEELSERLGKSRAGVANTLRLLSLSETVIGFVANEKLSAGHARALVTLPVEEQTRIANEAIKNDYSVREIEKAVKDYFNPPEETKTVKKVQNEIKQSQELKDLIERMQKTFGTKVAAIGNDNKGRIYIDYYARDDLDRLNEIVEFIEKKKKED